VFILDEASFVALGLLFSTSIFSYLTASVGASQSVFAECLPSDAISEIEAQYDKDPDVQCAVDDTCAGVQTNQLTAQVGTISTAIGAAGGGGIGCFCGSCLIAFIFFRRKKTKADKEFEVKVPSTGDDSQSVFKSRFCSNHLMNQLRR